MRLPPPARSLNPAVTPAVDSILRRCLAPNPARRYQSAAELQEDLDRQRQHRPLRHAPSRRIRERVVKWFRRNPRAVSASRVGVAAGVLVPAADVRAVLARRAGGAPTNRPIDSRDSAKTSARPGCCSAPARADVDERTEGRAAARRAVDRYGVDADGRWRDQPSFRRLSGRGKRPRTGGTRRSAGAAGVGHGQGEPARQAPGAT